MRQMITGVVAVFSLLVLSFSLNVTSVEAQVEGEIERVWVDHNVYEGDQRGMRIHVQFTAYNMRGSTGRISAYFYFRSGDALRDYNDNYNTTGGNVSVGREFTPGYANTVYNDFTLFMPYSELHLADGEHALYFHVLAWHYLGDGGTAFARSDRYYFSMNTGRPSYQTDDRGDYDTLTLQTGFLPDPYQIDLIAEGRVSAPDDCAGYITVEPDVVLNWSGGDFLRFYVESQGDTVLIVSDPSDRTYCNDDSFNTRNGTVTFTSAESGRYDIWVGTYEDDREIDATLNITELSSQHP